VSFKPDVIFAYAAAQLAPLSRETKTIPIIFVGASAPVEDGYIASYSRPGGNITGFTQYEPSMVGKWLAALKEVAPAIVRVALLVNPDTAPLRGTFYSNAFKNAAAALAVEPIAANVHSARDIETAMATLGRQPGSALIVARDLHHSQSRADHRARRAPSVACDLWPASIHSSGNIHRTLDRIQSALFRSLSTLWLPVLGCF
jgi:putative ABC transport system substrate-binding protein